MRSRYGIHPLLPYEVLAAEAAPGQCVLFLASIQVQRLAESRVAGRGPAMLCQPLMTQSCS